VGERQLVLGGHNYVPRTRCEGDKLVTCIILVGPGFSVLVDAVSEGYTHTSILEM